MTRLEILRCIRSQGERGEVKTLMDMIGKENFRNLCHIGIIKQGVSSIDNKPVRTWSVTDAIKDEYAFYFDTLTKEECDIVRLFAN